MAVDFKPEQFIIGGEMADAETTPGSPGAGKDGIPPLFRVERDESRRDPNSNQISDNSK